MATELDKLVVKIEADLSSLKKGMAQANKQVEQSSGKFKKSLNKMNASFKRLGATTVKYGAIAATVFGAVALRGILKSGIAVEELALRFNLFFGSVEEGQKAFKVLLKFAEKVPFSLGEIQAGAAPLLAVSKNSKELSKNLQIVGNLAAATGLDFSLAALQYQKVASAGIGAADLLRDTGVKAQLGFVEGMAFTAEESVKVFEENFLEGGRFSAATDDMAGTLRGVFSQITDSVEKFQQAIASTFIPTLTANFGDLVTTLRANSDEIKKIGEDIGRDLANALTFLIENREEIVFAIKTMGAVALIAAANFVTFGLAAKVAGLGLGFITRSKVARVMLMMAGITTALTGDIANFDKVLKDVNGRLKETEKALPKGLLIKIDPKNVEELKANMKLIEDFKTGVVDIFNEAGESMSDAFGKAIASGQSFRQSMLDIFQSVVAQVISLITQLLVIEPILESIEKSIMKVQTAREQSKKTKESNNLISQALGFFGGFGDGFFGGSGGGHIDSGSNFGASMFGLRAGGGSVNPNMPYMVGERGAEMFVPKSAGTIVPNNQVAGASGGGNIVIEQNLNFATGVSQTVRAEVMNLLPAIQQSTLSAVQDARLRGGTFAKDFGA